MEQDKTVTIDANGVLPHLGNMVARQLKKKRIRNSEIARKMGLNPQSINGYLQSESFQFRILWDLGMALEYNFLADLMEHLPAKVFHSTPSKFQDIILAQAQEIMDLNKEIEIYKGLLKR
jgi:transcriptional regulator with XRE-family HTH domain